MERAYGEREELSPSISIYIYVYMERGISIDYMERGAYIYIYVNTPLKLYGESTWREYMERAYGEREELSPCISKHIRICGERYKYLLYGERCIYIYICQQAIEAIWREYMERVHGESIWRQGGTLSIYIQIHMYI